MIPILLTKSWFKQLNSHITSFIWGTSSPRFKRTSLEMTKSTGGLGLPNFLFYFWAANISKLKYWISMHENKRGPMWAAMELESSLPLSPVSILSSSLPSNLSLQHLGPVIRNSLKIWLQFRKHFHFNQPITLLPLVRNHLFPPSQADTAFETWHRNGLVFFKDLFVDGTFASFDLLQKNNNIPKSHFFRYLQVCSFVKKHFPFPHLPPKNVLSTILELDPNGRRRVAKIYQTLQDIDPPSWESTRLAWEKDLDITLSEEIWQKSL